MKTFQRVFGAPFRYWYISSLLLGAGVILKIQIGGWVQKNGWSWHGTLVNHFGEAYDGTVIDWLARLASPFAIPGVIVVLFASSLPFVLPRLIWLLVRRSRSPERERKDQ